MGVNKSWPILSIICPLIFNSYSDSSLFFHQMGTGFSDEDLAKHHEFFQEHLIDKPRSYYRYGDSVKPDHWFDAVQVSLFTD